MSDYQVMPPLSAEEYAALEAEIAEHGVLVPIVTDQHGNLIDGHHRKQIADRLGLEYRVDVVNVADQDEARSLARIYNLARRHLTREQKRQLIADEITAHPSRSDREIGRLMGCDHKTVGAVRRELRGEIPHQPSAEEVRLAKELDDEVRAGVVEMDRKILVALLKGMPPAKVAHAILAQWRAVEAVSDGEHLDGIRRYGVEPRVAAVLQFPEGWYGDEGRAVLQLMGETP